VAAHGEAAATRSAATLKSSLMPATRTARRPRRWRCRDRAARAANRAVNNQADGSLFDRRCFTTTSHGHDALPGGQVLRRKQLLRYKHRSSMPPRSTLWPCALKTRCTASARRIVTRHLHEAALQRMHARATPQLMRLRRCVAEHPFASLNTGSREAAFVLARSWAAGTEMSLATLVWN